MAIIRKAFHVFHSAALAKPKFCCPSHPRRIKEDQRVVLPELKKPDLESHSKSWKGFQPSIRGIKHLRQILNAETGWKAPKPLNWPILQHATDYWLLIFHHYSSRSCALLQSILIRFYDTVFRLMDQTYSNIHGTVHLSHTHTHTSCRGSAQDPSWNTKSSWASILSLALCVNPVVKHLASLPVFIGLAGNSTPCSAVKKTSQLLLVWHLFSNWPCVYGLVVKPTFGLQWWLDWIPMKFIAALSSCQGCTCSVLVTNSPFAGETLNPQNICFSVW